MERGYAQSVSRSAPQCCGWSATQPRSLSNQDTAK